MQSDSLMITSVIPVEDFWELLTTDGNFFTQVSMILEGVLMKLLRIYRNIFGNSLWGEGKMRKG
jgi:hypothetical protein